MVPNLIYKGARRTIMPWTCPGDVPRREYLMNNGKLPRNDQVFQIVHGVSSPRMESSTFLSEPPSLPRKLTTPAIEINTQVTENFLMMQCTKAVGRKRQKRHLVPAVLVKA
jgi:hypothetical protein